MEAGVAHLLAEVGGVGDHQVVVVCPAGTGRLSVGLEDAPDLIADLEQALV